ncbi:Suppressor of tumorigenicity 14 protein [Trichinella spiralis]|uniref:Suppressor of tumorigenicity 14 protein n=1 Tax=Trichinella spiralis TaxID=6334 RepID=A0ABR3KI30_TRISP
MSEKGISVFTVFTIFLLIRNTGDAVNVSVNNRNDALHKMHRPPTVFIVEKNNNTIKCVGTIFTLKAGATKSDSVMTESGCFQNDQDGSWEDWTKYYIFAGYDEFMKTAKNEQSAIIREIKNVEIVKAKSFESVALPFVAVVTLEKPVLFGVRVNAALLPQPYETAKLSVNYFTTGYNTTTNSLHQIKANFNLKTSCIALPTSSDISYRGSTLIRAFASSSWLVFGLHVAEKSSSTKNTLTNEQICLFNRYFLTVFHEKFQNKVIRNKWREVFPTKVEDNVQIGSLNSAVENANLLQSVVVRIMNKRTQKIACTGILLALNSNDTMSSFALTEAACFENQERNKENFIVYTARRGYEWNAEIVENERFEISQINFIKGDMNLLNVEENLALITLDGKVSLDSGISVPVLLSRNEYNSLPKEFYVYGYSENGTLLFSKAHAYEGSVCLFFGGNQNAKFLGSAVLYMHQSTLYVVGMHKVSERENTNEEFIPERFYLLDQYTMQFLSYKVKQKSDAERRKSGPIAPKPELQNHMDSKERATDNVICSGLIIADNLENEKATKVVTEKSCLQPKHDGNWVDWRKYVVYSLKVFQNSSEPCIETSSKIAQVQDLGNNKASSLNNVLLTLESKLGNASGVKLNESMDNVQLNGNYYIIGIDFNYTMIELVPSDKMQVTGCSNSDVNQASAEQCILWKTSQAFLPLGEKLIKMKNGTAFLIGFQHQTASQNDERIQDASLSLVETPFSSIKGHIQVGRTYLEQTDYLDDTPTFTGFVPTFVPIPNKKWKDSKEQMKMTSNNLQEKKLQYKYCSQ